MKKTRKQLLKSAIAAVLCLCMAVVIAFGGIVTPATTASAETTYIQIPNCAISSSTTYANFNNEEPTWLSFKTTTAGDYTLNLGTDYVNIYGYVYDAATGQNIDYIDSEYWDCNYNRIFADKIIVSLEANTLYHFGMYLFSEDVSSYSVKVSMTKNTKSVKSITLNSFLVDYGCWFSKYDIDQHLFNYKVSYTDGSSAIMRCYQLESLGYDLPEISYLGNSTEINGESIAVAGEHLVVADYNGILSTLSIDVPSLTDYCSDLDPAYPFDICEIKYESLEEQLRYWRIKTNETAVFSIYTYSDNTFVDNLDEYSIEMVDENNNLVTYNDAIDGWPLVAGREYVLSFRYRFASYSQSYIDWWLEKEAGSMFPDAQPGGWYHDAVTYSSGRGILKGYANGYFGTADGIQRQDFLVMLARLDGVYLDDYSYSSSFPDVASGSYYQAAVNWGYENGIVTGYENGRFGVGDMINREQIVTFLYRYAQYKGLNVNVSSSAQQSIRNKYADYNSVSNYAINAVNWAINRGVISGKNNGTAIYPAGTAQRCEIAQIMYNIFVNDIF